MSKNIKELLGLKIKEYRINKGLTQENLAELADTEQKHISDIECGKSFVSSDLLERISEALNVKPKNLFDFYHLQTEVDLKKDIVSMLNLIKKEDLPVVYKIMKSFVE